MTISLFSRTQRSNKLPEIKEKEYASICGIIDIIEFKNTQKEISGVLLDSEGREFEFKVRPNGDLLQLTGLKEDLPLVWSICVDYLKKYYGKNELEEFKRLVNAKLNAINASILEISEQIEEIEIPEIIPQPQPLPVEEEEPQLSTQQIEKSFDNDEEEYKEQTFEDFSDEDLASHALKVLSGEVSLSG